MTDDFDVLQAAELDDDFGPADHAAALTSLLVAGHSRDEIARVMRISREEIDAHIADSTTAALTESLDEREWIMRERLRDLVRQASRDDLGSYEVARLGLLMNLARMEIDSIGIRRDLTALSKGKRR